MDSGTDWVIRAEFDFQSDPLYSLFMPWGKV